MNKQIEELDRLAKLIFGDSSNVSVRDAIDQRECVTVFASFGSTKFCTVYLLRHDNAIQITLNLFNNLTKNL